MAEDPLLIAVPNVSEGRDHAVLEALQGSVGPARFLDLHSDPDHDRSVFTLAAPQGRMAEALLRLARAAVERIDVTASQGIHPHVGALDVMPVVYLDEDRRGAACAEALVAAALVGEELQVPVFLYGELATRPEHRERAALRRGGPSELGRRLDAGELVPDYGPPRLHSTAGAVLAAARPPLVAFNVDLATDDLELAREIAAGLRESGGGLPGVRAIGLILSGGRAQISTNVHDPLAVPLAAVVARTGVRAIGLYLEDRGRAQVSTNVHDHRAVPLRDVVEYVRARAPVAEAELVGLAPRRAFEGFPEDVPLRAFDPERHLIEEALAAIG